MSEELKTCPFCDGEPKTTVMGPDNEWKCANPKCPIYGVKMLNTAWNTRPSSWIKITPETMPEDTEQEFLTINKVGTVSRCRGFANECDSKVWLIALSYYMPVPVLPSA